MRFWTVDYDNQVFIDYVIDQNKSVYINWAWYGTEGVLVRHGVREGAEGNPPLRGAQNALRAGVPAGLDPDG